MPQSPRTLAILVLAAVCLFIFAPFSQVSAQPTDSEPAIQVREVLGVGITDNMELEAVVKGEHVLIPLLGVQRPTEPCALTKQLSLIDKRIAGEIVYLVQYSPKNTQITSPQYVFLSDSTFLNRHIISDGLAVASASNHLYENEFHADELAAKNARFGIGSARCARVTATPSPTRAVVSKATVPVTSAAPIQKTAVRGESVRAAVNLSAYISPAATETPAPARSLSSERIFILINAHRKEKGLAPLEKDEQLCKLAESRAPELHDEIFGGSYVHAGLEKRDIPYWITENMASYGSEEAIVTWWLGSLIHRRAIEGSNTYSCGACSGNSCTQLFTSYVKK